MTEFTSPALVTLPDGMTLTDGVFELARDRPEQVVIRYKVGGEFVDMTYREFADRVLATAGGLVAHGVGPGDRVALMSRTRYEWTILDYAIWMAGAVTVPIYETSSADQIEWILTDAAVSLAVVETRAHADLVAEAQARDHAPALRDVLVIDDGALATLATDGAAVTADQLAAARADVRGASLATIIYTSGTTGRPKGCELSHGALLFDAKAAEAHLPELFGRGSDPSTLLFLPLAHAFARLVQNAAVQLGFPLAYSSDVSTLVEDLGKSRPTYLLAAPRIFEKVHARARQTAHSSGRGRIFDAAENVAIAYSQALDIPGGPGLGLRARHAVFDRLVYTKLRAVLGGRVGYAISGSAPLSERLGHFFRGLGVVVLEGYGLTETAPALAANRPGHVKMGTVGQPFGGVTVRIADDGEILVRGPLLFSGYHGNETATKEALDPDGFFRTGDLGTLDADGFLRITGRKKEILVTAGGKNVAPAPLEQQLQTHPLISQAMVIGDRRPFVAALVTLDEETLGHWLTDRGRPADTPPAALVHDKEVLAEVQGAIDAANASVSHAESIKKFAVLPVDFTVENGELTPSLKVRRAAVMERFADTVTDIYDGPARR